jgi:hypothetical protein
MKYLDEEEIGRLIREGYGQVSPSSGSKERAKGYLLDEIGSHSDRGSSLWERPTLLVPILASAAAGLIAYGCWLSTTFV